MDLNILLVDGLGVVRRLVLRTFGSDVHLPRTRLARMAGADCPLVEAENYR
jgi:hypothetical protein